MIVNLLNKLITKKYYSNKEDITNKCSVFFAMNVISEEEYSNLVLKIEEVYFVPIEETTDEVVEEVVE